MHPESSFCFTHVYNIHIHIHKNTHVYTNENINTLEPDNIHKRALNNS